MSARATTIERPSSLETHRAEDGNLRVRLRGSWTVEAGGVALEEARKTMAGAARVTLDGEALEGWDSVLVQAILVFRREARDRGLPFDLIGIDTTTLTNEDGSAKNNDYQRIIRGVIGLILMSPEAMRR